MIYRKDPTPETLANRRAADEMVHGAATRGCPIAGALCALLLASSVDPVTRYMTTTAYDFRDEDEDDDIRPF